MSSNLSEKFVVLVFVFYSSIFLTDQICRSRVKGQDPFIEDEFVIVPSAEHGGQLLINTGQNNGNEFVPSYPVPEVNMNLRSLQTVNNLLQTRNTSFVIEANEGEIIDLIARGLIQEEQVVPLTTLLEVYDATKEDLTFHPNTPYIPTTWPEQQTDINDGADSIASMIPENVDGFQTVDASSSNFLNTPQLVSPGTVVFPDSFEENIFQRSSSQENNNSTSDYKMELGRRLRNSSRENNTSESEATAGETFPTLVSSFPEHADSVVMPEGNTFKYNNFTSPAHLAELAEESNQLTNDDALSNNNSQRNINTSKLNPNPEESDQLINLGGKSANFIENSDRADVDFNGDDVDDQTILEELDDSNGTNISPELAFSTTTEVPADNVPSIAVNVANQTKNLFQNHKIEQSIQQIFSGVRNIDAQPVEYVYEKITVRFNNKEPTSIPKVQNETWFRPANTISPPGDVRCPPVPGRTQKKNSTTTQSTVCGEQVFKRFEDFNDPESLKIWRYLFPCYGTMPPCRQSGRWPAAPMKNEPEFFKINFDDSSAFVQSPGVSNDGFRRFDTHKGRRNVHSVPPSNCKSKSDHKKIEGLQKNRSVSPNKFVKRTHRRPDLFGVTKQTTKNFGDFESVKNKLALGYSRLNKRLKG